MKGLILSSLVPAAGLILAVVSGWTEDNSRTSVFFAEAPPEARSNGHYVSNRPPLLASPLVKLPIGAIAPRGWLLSQLQLMREGLTGRLVEISPFLKEDSGWVTVKGKGWEEMPYWLKGYGDLGYILKDERIAATAKKWLETAFRSQQPDGYFGPPENKSEPDLWPNMIMLFALQSYYERSGDSRVLSFMTDYFRYEWNLPEERLLPGSWQKLRGGDNLESVYWLYNRTGDKFLLDLGQRLFARTSDWTSPILTPERDALGEESSFYHGVNIAMGIRQPGVFYQQSKNPKYLQAVERNYALVMAAYGQQPGGMFGADENIRPGANDPRQGAETCTMVELMFSFESLLRITGDPRYADRAEEIALNSLPASMTPDLKGLHYLTAPNLISCDSSGEHDFQNGGNLLSYDPWKYRCCQHNVAFGWPYLAEHLWMATSDNGLAAVFYAPSLVTATVGRGEQIRICQETRYPFDGLVDLTISTENPVDFPLYLRIPAWSTTSRLWVNGNEVRNDARGGGYCVASRLWRNGDQVRILFSQNIEVKSWPAAGGGVSVKRGPLWFSLRIGESWKRCGGTDEWPAYEVLPATAWNYGLLLDTEDPSSSIRLAEEKAPAYQPFEPSAAPVILKARAKRLPEWKADGRMAGRVPPGPRFSSEPTEEVDLIPMGCARLRIAVFPVVRDDSGSRPKR